MKKILFRSEKSIYSKSIYNTCLQLKEMVFNALRFFVNVNVLNTNSIILFTAYFGVFTYLYFYILFYYLFTIVVK